VKERNRQRKGNEEWKYRRQDTVGERQKPRESDEERKREKLFVCVRECICPTKNGQRKEDKRRKRETKRKRERKV